MSDPCSSVVFSFDQTVRRSEVFHNKPFEFVFFNHFDVKFFHRSCSCSFSPLSPSIPPFLSLPCYLHFSIYSNQTKNLAGSATEKMSPQHKHVTLTSLAGVTTVCHHDVSPQCVTVVVSPSMSQQHVAERL